MRNWKLIVRIEIGTIVEIKGERGDTRIKRKIKRRIWEEWRKICWARKRKLKIRKIIRINRLWFKKELIRYIIKRKRIKWVERWKKEIRVNYREFGIRSR